MNFIQGAVLSRITEDPRQQALLEQAIELALTEDQVGQDITSLSTIPDETTAVAQVVFKQPAVIAGLEIARLIFGKIDSSIKFVNKLNDGDLVSAVPQITAVVSGKARSILTAERTALNFLQRLSGIATNTRKYVEAVAGSGIEILDTRKTTPGLRVFERYAVRLGGGCNHRFSLADAVLIKDNHLDIAGGVQSAMESCRQRNFNCALEIEARTLSEVREALAARADIVLLDNMSPELIRQAVEIIGGRCRIEVSGGITLSNIRQYLVSGVSAISIGALTHSAPSVDISLEVEANHGS